MNGALALRLPSSRPPHRLALPQARDEHGELRRVGVEIELIGLDLDAMSALLVSMFGGQVERVTEYVERVVDTTLGDFRVEVDSAPLKAIGKKRARASRTITALDRIKEALLGVIAPEVTPHEIATAPIAPEQLGQIDQLARALGRAGARGASSSPLYVMGLHFNPSVPSTDPLRLLDYIRAYSILHEWLRHRLHTRPSRRFMRYAAPYPKAYIRKVLSPSYAPSLGELIDDYLEHNPTRNRALDLLPLWKHLDAPRVARVVDDKRVKARPTFHFRLPNSDVGDPRFRVTDAWLAWLSVEHLANDPAQIDRLAAKAQRDLSSLIGAFRRRWGLTPVSPFVSLPPSAFDADFSSRAPRTGLTRWARR